jgi:integrase
MKLVKVEGATRHIKPRSLSLVELQGFCQKLPAPFNLIALLCGSLGLRISECLALRWSDIGWLDGKLRVERGIVRQIVDTTKTDGSRKTVSLDTSLVDALKQWRGCAGFTDPEDYIFASPTQYGACPLSYPWVWVQFQRAAAASGLGKLGTHSMRHTYRSLLDEVGTSIAVQQKLMRHADIRTTMVTYGDVVTDEEAVANSKVARNPRQVISAAACSLPAVLLVIH